MSATDDFFPLDKKLAKAYYLFAMGYFSNKTRPAPDVCASYEELSLDKAHRERSYLIVSNSASGRNRMRMDSLGLMPGEAIHVLFSNFSGLIVAIKGSRLALGRSLAARLTVRELPNGDRTSDVSA